jgi:chromosome segregation ATPase
MTTRNGQELNASDEVIRLVATLQTSLTKLVDGQKVAREEIRALGGRIDALAGKIEVVAARVEALAERVHRSNNILTPFVEELSVLRESQAALDRALDFVETQQKAKLQDLERAHVALERAVEFVENRVRQVRDRVADDESEAKGTGSG